MASRNAIYGTVIPEKWARNFLEVIGQAVQGLLAATRSQAHPLRHTDQSPSIAFQTGFRAFFASRACTTARPLTQEYRLVSALKTRATGLRSHTSSWTFTPHGKIQQKLGQPSL